jgi:hypothetical protein
VLPLFAATEPIVMRSGLKNAKIGPTQWSAFGWNVWEMELSK